MQGTEKERLKKIIGVSIILIVLIGIVLLGVTLTRSIMEHSYNTEDVLSEVSSATDNSEIVLDTEDYIGGYSYEGFKNLPSAQQAVLLMREVPTDDLAKASVEKVTVLLSCEESPYYTYISGASYKIGKVSSGYKVEYFVGDEELHILCSDEDGTPIVFTKDTEFTEEEKVFFKKLGNYKEVTNDDGTYSIIFL